MNTPPPSPRPLPRAVTQPPHTPRFDDAQVRQWLQLRREMTELHARLEYLKLMLKLDVR